MMIRCLHRNSKHLLLRVLGVFSISAMLILTLGNEADAAEPGPVVSLVIDGKGIAADVQPIQREGRMLVPIRVIAETTGAQVQYEETARQVTVSDQGKRIVIPVEQSVAYVNGKQVTLDVPATIMQSRTLVPLRFINESLGFQVDWKEDSNVAMVWTEDEELAKSAASPYSAIEDDSYVFPFAAESEYEPYVNSFGSNREWTESGNGSVRSHEGIDIMAPIGSPVYSVSSGTINRIGWNTYGGWRINITDDSGKYRMYYAHLSAFAPELEIGSEVSAGQLIGFVGDSGYGDPGTTGMFPSHLHFGLYDAKSGDALDAYSYLRNWEQNKVDNNS
jgi:peptidoglycan LD-endopeptidase LytH